MRHCSSLNEWWEVEVVEVVSSHWGRNARRWPCYWKVRLRARSENKFVILIFMLFSEYNRKRMHYVVSSFIISLRFRASPLPTRQDGVTLNQGASVNMTAVEFLFRTLLSSTRPHNYEQDKPMTTKTVSTATNLFSQLPFLSKCVTMQQNATKRERFKDVTQQRHFALQYYESE